MTLSSDNEQHQHDEPKAEDDDAFSLSPIPSHLEGAQVDLSRRASTNTSESQLFVAFQPPTFASQLELTGR